MVTLPALKRRRGLAIKNVRSILIVGGGSAGWMTAAYLSKVLIDVRITLIESPITPIIGVGEATFPFIQGFMSRIGLPDDRLWMPECDATYKAGILFEDWYAVGDSYWHPLFEDLEYIEAHTHVGHCWLNLHQAGHAAFRKRSSFYDTCFSSVRLNVIEKRVPISGEYAYHFNAYKFAELLRSTAPSVYQVKDHVVGVELNEQGEIVSLATQNSGQLTADLFIDCSGFRRLLIGHMPESNHFAPYTNSLLCDSAVVLRFPYRGAAAKSEEMLPFVRCSARSAGWIWTIPLYSQISSGYVYASSFVTHDQAEQELRRFWGEARTAGIEPLKLRFTAGKLSRLWAKNCVAVGLAGGFVEPLESTSLAIIQHGVEMLASMLDARFWDESMVSRYNAYLEKFYADIVQFIMVHYSLTSREDTPFWQAVKHDTCLPEGLQARLEVFRQLLPTMATRGTAEPWMFRDLSWFSVLLGMNFPFAAQTVSDSALNAFELVLRKKQQTTGELRRKLPNHYSYLKDEVYGQGTEPSEQEPVLPNA